MSIVYQSENTTLQFGDTGGNIAHSGILGSCIESTPSLSHAFPSGPTGTSRGHYHYTDPDTGALQFLNAAGNLGAGGHEFYVSTITDAPLRTARIDVNGLTFDTSQGGGSGTVIYSPPIEALVDGSHIDFSGTTNLHNAPYNFNQTFNPIYLTQSNGFYVTGELAYAFITNGGSQIQIFKNNNTTNPIPPNTVPSGFPTTNTNGLTIGQPIFSLTLPSPTPVITTNLQENLTIQNDKQICTLTAFDFKLDDGGNNTSYLDNHSLLLESHTGSTTVVEINNIAIENGTYVRSTVISDSDLTIANDQTTAELTSLTLTISRPATTEQSLLTTKKLTLHDAGNNVSMLSPTSLLVDNGASNTSFIDNTGITVRTATHNSVLTATDLTFDNVSSKPSTWSIYPPTQDVDFQQYALFVKEIAVTTDYLQQTLLYNDKVLVQDNNIGTYSGIYAPVTAEDNTALYSQGSNSTATLKVKPNAPEFTLAGTSTAVLTTQDLTFNGTSVTKSISKLQYANPINIANSPLIYGTLPSSPPMIPTTNAINSGVNGWYYKNISSAYNNISWAIGFQPSAYVVSNLKGFYFTFVSLTTTSKPFMSVYTLPAQAPGGFYNSRRSYVPAGAPATITAGIPYIYYYMYDSAYPTPFKYCHTAVPLTLSPVGQVGAFGANELLYFASINTNSISAIGIEELIITESGVIIDDGTGTLIQPFNYNGSDVYSPNSYKNVLQGAGTITPTVSDNGTTYIATANFTIANTGLSGVPAGYFIKVHGSSVDRVITYNTSSTVTVHTTGGNQNAQEVIFYWTGTVFAPYF